jgi:tetratricopeptide (TPR) repeat protein
VTLPDVVAATAARPQDVLADTLPPVATPTPLESNRAQTLVQRAVAAQEAGELTRAISLLEQAVKLDPSAKAAYNSLGNVYYQQRRYQQALAMYDKALAIDPDYTKARNNLGSTYMKLAMDTRAIEELQRALRTDSSYSLTYYNLACVYARGGDSTIAAQYLQQAIALEPQARTWARTDADFAPVRAAPAVQQLLGP